MQDYLWQIVYWSHTEREILKYKVIKETPKTFYVKGKYGLSAIGTTVHKKSVGKNYFLSKLEAIENAIKNHEEHIEKTSMELIAPKDELKKLKRMRRRLKSNEKGVI